MLCRTAQFLRETSQIVLHFRSIPETDGTVIIEHGALAMFDSTLSFIPIIPSPPPRYQYHHHQMTGNSGRAQPTTHQITQ